METYLPITKGNSSNDDFNKKLDNLHRLLSNMSQSPGE